MSRSQRHLRDRQGISSSGDTHYPGSDYIYDWPGTWPSGSGGAFGVTITGLTSGQAIIGAHAGVSYTINPDNGTETVKWSASANPADAAAYGTGASPTDYTSADGFSLYLHVTDGPSTVTRSAPVRYAAGTAPVIADGQAWIVDDTAVNINAAASGANLTWTYVLTGATAGVSINSGSGLITGAPTGVGSGTATVTATDQYGRTVSDTFTWSAALRTQATGGADLDLSFAEGGAITPTDLAANWTLNGNTLTYAITGTALPAGLSVSSAGVMTGTPTTATGDATYTLRGTDEYGRITDDTFTLEIFAGSITAVVPPVDQRTYAGQRVDQLANYSTLVDLGNYSSSLGTINGAVIQTSDDEGGTWTTRAGSYVFEITQVVSVFVTDDQGVNERWVIEDEVEFDYVINAIVGNEIDISINDIVPDAYALSITLTGPYAGTYTPTAVQIRGNVHNFAGTVGAISGTPGVGELLTHTENGLWSTPTGDLTLSKNWQADDLGGGSFADLVGINGDTFTVGGTEAGDDVRVRVEGDDLVNTPLNAFSAAISIPSGAVIPAVAQVYNYPSFNTTGNALVLEIPFDFSARTTGEAAVLALVSRHSTNGIASVQLVSADLSTTACTIHTESAQRVSVMMLSTTVPANKTGAVEITLDASVNYSGTNDMWGFGLIVPGATTFVGTNGTTASTNPVTATADEVADGVMIVVAAEDRATGGITITGIDTANQVTLVPTTNTNTTYSAVLNYEDITVNASGVTYTGTMDGNGHSGMATLMVT